MTNQTRAYYYAGITVLLWSTVAAAFKLSLRYLSPQELLLFATFVSCVVLLCILLVNGHYREFRSWTSSDFFRSAMLGFLNPFLYYRVLFEAYALLPAQVVQPLNFAWPIVLALLSMIVLGQRISIFSLAAMSISFAGVAVIATRGDVLSLHIADSKGVLLALGSTVIWATYWIYGLKDRRDPIARLFANFVFGGIFVSVYTSPDTTVVVNCAGRTRSIIGAQTLINAHIPNRVEAFWGTLQSRRFGGRCNLLRLMAWSPPVAHFYAHNAKKALMRRVVKGPA